MTYDKELQQKRINYDVMQQEENNNDRNKGDIDRKMMYLTPY